MCVLFYYGESNISCISDINMHVMLSSDVKQKNPTDKLEPIKLDMWDCSVHDSKFKAMTTKSAIYGS